MNHKNIPLLNFDPTRKAIIEPGKIIQPRDVPEHCVICFFAEVIEWVKENYNPREVWRSSSEIGPHPLYEIDFQGQRLAFFHPGVGAPLAAGLLEEMIAVGCRKFIACGSCGVLDPEIAVGHLLLPVAAIRDEGTSYHYLPPSREVEADPRGVEALESVLKRHGLAYIRTKTWTTDGIYRETPAKAARYLEEGCLTVEMEAAAFFAVAKFRQVTFAQLLYGGDAVIEEGWDGRGWHRRIDIRRNLFWLAAEAVLEL
ncbi:MAG TPA: nucleoside phosphorylase [Brevefilum sp.]|nr:nucleoside phosphorylase [Brevefilum sp.]